MEVDTIRFLFAIRKGSCQWMGFSLLGFLRVLVFLVLLTVGFGFVLLVEFCLDYGTLYILLVAEYSSRALGAGFRSGLCPTVSTTLTMGWTGQRFVAAISFANSCYFCNYSFALRPQL